MNKSESKVNSDGFIPIEEGLVIFLIEEVGIILLRTNETFVSAATSLSLAQKTKYSTKKNMMNRFERYITLHKKEFCKLRLHQEHLSVKFECEQGY